MVSSFKIWTASRQVQCCVPCQPKTLDTIWDAQYVHSSSVRIGRVDVCNDLFSYNTRSFLLHYSSTLVSSETLLTPNCDDLRRIQSFVFGTFFRSSALFSTQSVQGIIFQCGFTINTNGNLRKDSIPHNYGPTNWTTFEIFPTLKLQARSPRSQSQFIGCRST